MVASVPRPAASPRAVAAYLVSLRPVLAEATMARQNWVHRIGVLMEDARTGNVTTVAQKAGRVGRDQLMAFRGARARLDSLAPPQVCAPCHGSLAQWLDRLTASCQVLVDVGQTGRLERIRETQALLAESRVHARDFNGEYARLVDELRVRAAGANRGRRTRSGRA